MDVLFSDFEKHFSNFILHIDRWCRSVVQC